MGLLDSAGGEIGTGDDLRSGLCVEARITYQRDGRVNDLREIMRRNIGRHPDGDTARPFTKRLGIFVGNTEGSVKDSS